MNMDFSIKWPWKGIITMTENSEYFAVHCIVKPFVVCD